MGGAKAAWMEAQERGWDAPEKHVCPDCVSDPYLKALIEGGVTSRTCDYCGEQADTEIAAPVEEIMPAVMGALTHYFAEPGGAGVPYESAEGGYLVEPTDTADALMSLPLECNDELFDDIVSAIAHFNDGWVEAGQGHWASEQKNQELIGGWNRFSNHVKHRQRYFFTATERDFGQDIEPSRLMPELASVVSELELIEGMDADTPLFRVRARSPSNTWSMDAENLGAPPSRRAAAGRMNPPGISYLYLALEPATAAAEIVRGPPCSLALAHFRTTRPLRLLNLIDLPAIPSIFDYERLREREFLVFLAEFVQAISRPVEKDGAEHIEYVPSQIVCEYFASVFQPDSPLDGLLYPSAVSKGGRNLVLFPRFDEGDNQFPQVLFQDSWTAVAEDWTALSKLIGSSRGVP
ncbi:HEPN-associated N-terminal domain-containing protein [Solimonas soli]|uniref:HEPN-associated N-terminal domain-containing protein n=1 Tax=Solimonas soli TaxID=413479 RepID=UPI0009FDD9A5|nr:HEPN-associated N-terminal domain-containing protein [Solimonas soli]